MDFPEYGGKECVDEDGKKIEISKGQNIILISFSFNKQVNSSLNPRTNHHYFFQWGEITKGSPNVSDRIS